MYKTNYRHSHSDLKRCLQAKNKEALDYVYNTVNEALYRTCNLPYDTTNDDTIICMVTVADGTKHIVVIRMVD